MESVAGFTRSTQSGFLIRRIITQMTWSRCLRLKGWPTLPKFSVGDIVRPNIRGLDHNIAVIESTEVKNFFPLGLPPQKGVTVYYARIKKSGDLWPFREEQIELAPPLDALASL